LPYGTSKFKDAGPQNLQWGKIIMNGQSRAIEGSGIATGKPVFDLRGRLIAVCMITGFSIPAFGMGDHGYVDWRT
jgi:hypothetical protein